jgi:ribonuclease BN (tRNA processing enzyme)
MTDTAGNSGDADRADEEVPLTKDPSCGPIPTARVGSASARLVNGVFGDPLLRLELLYQRRSLLFDLGDPGRLAARVAHQVTDLFLSHTHADHIGGFLWFLRSRIGDLPTCRCYGPPGLAGQITGLVGGILWDRVGARAPRFEVREWHDDHLRCYRVVAGEPGPLRLPDLPLVDGVLLREAGFLVRGAKLDHGTPVLAFAWEPALRVKVRRERLEALALRPGRWLQTLKQAVLAAQWDAVIELPDGSSRPVQALSDDLLLLQPGGKLVYATDFADTTDNRRTLTALARGAHSLFCEASFMQEHAEQARRTGHLTTRACAEIANAAGVQQLLPFHFSRRYIHRTAEIYREIHAHCPHTVLPGFLRAADGA